MADDGASYTQSDNTVEDDDELDVEDGDSTQPDTPSRFNDKPLTEWELENEQFTKIEIKTEGKVTWKNANEDIGSLSLDIKIDTVANKAMFKLSCAVFLKMKNKNKQSIFLFIYPEDVCSITTNDDASSLHFSMHKYPTLVIPRGPLELKPRSRHLLQMMQSLALVKNFTIQLNSPKTIEPTQLQQVAVIFSPTNLSNRPSRDYDSANLQSLYHGKGGEIGNAETNGKSACNEAILPPRYEVSAPNERRKRKRSSSSSDTATRLRDLEMHFSSLEKTLVNCLEAGFARIETRMRRFENSKSAIHYSEKLETAVEEVQNQLTEKLETAVEEEVQNQLTDFHEIILGKFYDTEKDLEKTVEDVENKVDVKLNEADKRLEVLEEDVRYMGRNIPKKIQQELLKMHLKISFDE